MMRERRAAREREKHRAARAPKVAAGCTRVVQEWCRHLLSSDQPIEVREVELMDTENLLETTEDSELDFSIEKIFEELDSEVRIRARIMQLRVPDAEGDSSSEDVDVEDEALFTDIGRRLACAVEFAAGAEIAGVLVTGVHEHEHPLAAELRQKINNDYKDTVFRSELYPDLPVRGPHGYGRSDLKPGTRPTCAHEYRMMGRERSGGRATELGVPATEAVRLGAAEWMVKPPLRPEEEGPERLERAARSRGPPRAKIADREGQLLPADHRRDLGADGQTGDVVDHRPIQGVPSSPDGGGVPPHYDHLNADRATPVVCVGDGTDELAASVTTGT
jgi:hypothetical protein